MTQLSSVRHLRQRKIRLSKPERMTAGARESGKVGLSEDGQETGADGTEADGGDGTGVGRRSVRGILGRGGNGGVCRASGDNRCGGGGGAGSRHSCVAGRVDRGDARGDRGDARNRGVRGRGRRHVFDGRRVERRGGGRGCVSGGLNLAYFATVSIEYINVPALSGEKGKRLTVVDLADVASRGHVGGGDGGADNRQERDQRRTHFGDGAEVVARNWNSAMMCE